MGGVSILWFRYPLSGNCPNKVCVMLGKVKNIQWTTLPVLFNDKNVWGEEEAHHKLRYPPR